MADTGTAGPAPKDAPPPRRPPAPPTPPDQPASSPPAGWQVLWTLQNAALVVFMGLALAVTIVGIYTVIFPPQEGAHVAIAFRVLDVLLIAILVSVTVAWFSSANAQMLGRGIQHLLSINRAALTSFIVSGTATVAILIYVAVAAMSSAEVEHGLYLLAAIELLLKLTAVSAIIVLITLRRSAPTIIAPAPAGSDPSAPVVVESSDDRGRLEFGSLAFAFGLIVIAGLVVPTDDLMRLSNMLFGGDKKIEDYLPQQPLVRVEDDMSAQIAIAVQNAPAMRELTDEMPSAEQQELYNAINAQVERVIYSVVADRIKRIGAWSLFEDICEDAEDAIIFINSNNKLVSEHIVYLASEGLVEFPYGDLTSLEMTPYGSQVIAKELGRTCAVAGTMQSPTTTIDPAFPPVASDTIDVDSSERTVDVAPIGIPLELSRGGTIIKLQLPQGDYVATLVAIDRIDPMLQLYDEEGILQDQNDDGGPGAFDSAISFNVDPSEVLYVRALSFDARAGNARLEITLAREELSAAQLADQQQALALAEIVEVPLDGAVYAFTALEAGEHIIHTSVPPDGVPTADITATLLRKGRNGYEVIAEDDDSGTDTFPIVTASLAAGETYYLVLRHYSREEALPAQVRIRVYPEVGAAQMPEDTVVGTEAMP